jgi:hypothetical protein
VIFGGPALIDLDQIQPDLLTCEKNDSPKKWLEGSFAWWNRTVGAPVATFFEGDAEAIIEKAEPIIAKDGRRAWIVQD